MALSRSQIDKFNNHLQRHLKSLDCRQCGGVQLQFAEIISVDFLNDGIAAGKTRMVPRVCQTCGHVTLYAAEVMER